MDMITSLNASLDHGLQSRRDQRKQALVIVVSDSPDTVSEIESVCDFFDIGIEVVGHGADLLTVLRASRPMAVVTDIAGLEQDGFYAMKRVAMHDRDLPTLLLTAGDPVLMGAADAVQEMCGLTMVTQSTCSHLAGQLAEFLFTAGRQAGCMRLVPV